MSETIKWSFSTDRCVRRCQRQYFLQHVAAWHNARDPVRREAFLLKQVKTLDLWQGSLVHGRSFGSEQTGFFDALTRLINDGLLDRDVQRGVVEVYKTSAEGVRLVEALNDGKRRNPTVGAWEELGDGEGLVCTTGFPFKLRGTVKPLVVRVAAGDLRLEYVLEDTFAMSQLCWPAPDRCMRLSIDLKLCDDYLRSIAADADEDAGRFGDEDEEWAEQEERVAAGGGA